MLIFPVLFALAIHYHSQPEIHKRLMVLTGTMLMVAAVARMVLNGIIPGNPFLFLAVWLSPVFVAIAHDAWFQRRLHPVYAIGVIALSAVPPRMALVETEAWKSVTSWTARVLVS